jgi:hypothetical protein
MSVRKAIAAFLLACFGMLIPTVATPLRVCMLEQRVFSTEVRSNANCCSDCTRETDDRNPCCLDLEALPDSSVPQPSISLPPVIVTHLQERVIVSPPWIESVDEVKAFVEPVRGPAPPAARRAVLGVWRL